ncbi:hypothetical protein [Rhizobium leguminosarum]|uniref:hypothetical protein n=1 Tax=Rhizobium leguminosarum TaxID=384 RepID=UPI002E104E8A|nr:hypothetical protein U8Q02_39340 [Rhizobium leguminosarum]
MPLPTRTYSHRVAIDIPVEDFNLVLKQEAISFYREFELPNLTGMLGGIDDVGDVEYDGHFGSAVHATFDLDDDGEKPQLDAFVEKIETFIEDLRRVDRFMPDLFEYPRHEIDKYQEMEDGKVRRRNLIYSHPDFVLCDSVDDDVVTVFHLRNGEPAMTDVNAPAIRDALFADLDMRSFDPHKRKAVNLSRDLPEVDAVILPHIVSPVKMKRIRATSGAPAQKEATDFSSHFLFDDLPAGAVPLHAAAKWIVADSGPEIGTSITFRTDGEAGHKYFTEGARQQLLDLARGNPGGLDNWIRMALPEDLDGPAAALRR